jgi:hypothetical protein
MDPQDLQMGERLCMSSVRCMSSLRTSAMAADCCCVGQATANKLTDDALLDIFDFYLNDNDPYRISKRQ